MGHYSPGLLVSVPPDNGHMLRHTTMVGVVCQTGEDTLSCLLWWFTFQCCWKQICGSYRRCEIVRWGRDGRCVADAWYLRVDEHCVDGYVMLVSVCLRCQAQSIPIFPSRLCDSWTPKVHAVVMRGCMGLWTFSTFVGQRRFDSTGSGKEVGNSEAHRSIAPG